MKLLFSGMMTFVLFALTMPRPLAGAELLQASIEKQVSLQEARQLAFEGVSPVKNLRTVPGVDEDCMRERSTATKALRFFDGFCIVHPPNSRVMYYYTRYGLLSQVEFYNTFSFPAIGHVYRYPKGTLEAVRYYASREETLNFTPDGKLHSQWRGNTCFDASGRIIAQRDDGG
jgi:hypothetical protein